jgi:hypothetical protein
MSLQSVSVSVCALAAKAMGSVATFVVWSIFALSAVYALSVIGSASAALSPEALLDLIYSFMSRPADIV